MIEIRIGVIGNVDSGKSTLVSVLSNGKLDDGRGLARRLILKHPPEVFLIKFYKINISSPSFIIGQLYQYIQEHRVIILV